ncbi:MAG: helix-turn-helix transcriptional regulator [Chloroflexi bacterium]|jgi:transcriptional regulator with XRE-family HTH domain|nr:helix-turn-helix transcriptional regulator [Chloroflexota bacterium]MBT3669735.1 helix-turn-helix transcriptional regulator [Chloroflexota bacterium]MBT4003425.1 helix-turn-helix transcriptional regulator [Chloroflexota bacterium]MBT4305215.1 helix-turn-helix transcriptional regulator [Chloroflexota bacterium]MBT4534862.1 helix-turn-helix transcriptional regulator [Chloroflexota bacterium]
MNLKLATTIRAKKLGVLIRNARQAAGRSKKECGQGIGVSSSTINSFENGVKSPSLPQLEMIALSLRVPIEYFWRADIQIDPSEGTENLHIEHHISLRNLAIGKILNKTRTQLELSLKDIREKTGITPGRLKKYESGESSIQLSELEILCDVLNLRLIDIIASDNPVGEWVHEQKFISDFKNLPLETQEFISQPINQPYIDLATRLSTLSTEQLRAVAEGLLEITI